MQRSDLLLVLLQQAVDGGDVVVDLRNGTAASLGCPGHGDEVFARLDQREILRNGIDVRKDRVDERVFRADDRRQRIPLVLGLDDDLPAYARRKGDRGAQRRSE